jgi:glutamate-5-semialdehyde dehydrogenase
MLSKYISYFDDARSAGRKSVDPGIINQVLNDVALAAIAQTDYLLEENQKDLDLMDPKDPKYDRLKLTTDRIADKSTSWCGRRYL